MARWLRHALFSLISLGFLLGASLQAAVVATDRLDYPPGSTVAISGSGFQPGEPVRLQVIHDGLSGDSLTSGAHAPWYATADASGNVDTTWSVPADEDELGALLELTATGQTSGVVASAQFTDGPIAGNLDQAHNGGVGKTPVSPVDWVNGNANKSNSHFAEGDSMPYRLVLTGLTAGDTYTVDIEWDIRDNGLNAFDYLTSYDRIGEAVDPLRGLGLGSVTPTLWNIPTPPVWTTVGTVGSLPQPTTSFASLPANERKFAIFNGDNPTLTYVNNAKGNLGDLTEANSFSRLRINFRATASTTVLAWGGHIASRLDWGEGHSAGNISGSPYHTRFIDLDGSGGNQDRSLDAQAVCVPPTVSIAGAAEVCGDSTSTFTVTSDSTLIAWSIAGDGTISGSTTGSSVTVIAGASGSYTLTVTASRSEADGGCSKSATKTVTVNALPDCTITGPKLPIFAGTKVTFGGVAGMTSYAWTVAYDGGTPVPVTGVDNEITVVIPVLSTSITVSLTVTDSKGCSNTCERTIDITAIDCVALTPQTTCPGTSHFYDLGGPQPGDVQWTIVSVPPGVAQIVGSDTGTSVTVSASKCSSYTLSYTVTPPGGIGTTCPGVTSSFVDTTPPEISGVGPDASVECTAPVVFSEPTAKDDCDPNPSLTHEDSTVEGKCAGSKSVTRTWTATDACGNSSQAKQTITVLDTTPPVISVPPDVTFAACGSDCPTDPASTGLATVEDNCDPSVKVTYQDTVSGSCPRIVTRVWSATDACGNSAKATQVIRCLPPIMVTDSSLCSYDMDPSTPCKDFRLLFTQDPQNFPNYKLTASNPGQTYYNAFGTGKPADVLTFVMTIPYPYVTQGANPIHAYDGVTATPNSSGACLVPGNGIPLTVIGGTVPITLASYGNNPTYKVTVQVVVPASGVVYVNMHLDYGLKGTGGYLPNAKGDAVSSLNTALVLVPNGGTYTFSLGGSQSGSDAICNMNVFKKNPGVGGQSKKPLSGDASPGSSLTLKSPSGQIVASAISDQDGWYLLNYKHTGKSADYTIRLVAPGGASQTKLVTLKANSYAQVDFEVP